MEGTSRVALFDLIVERGGLPESQAAQYFDAIVRLTEGALRRDPRYRLMTDHLLITRKGKIELQPPGVKRAPIDRHAPLSPKNQRRHDEPASCNQLEPASCTPADLGEAIADCTKAVRSFESNGESSAAMWALGIVLFSLLAGYPPFAATSSKCRFVLTFFLPDAHHRASIGRRASSRVKFLSSVPTTSSRGRRRIERMCPLPIPILSPVPSSPVQVLHRVRHLERAALPRLFLRVRGQPALRPSRHCSLRAALMGRAGGSGQRVDRRIPRRCVRRLHLFLH